jgi:hypothetical protein
MSIILKALKKLQEEKAREVAGPPADAAEKANAPSAARAIPSSLAIDEDEFGAETVKGYGADTAGPALRESAKQEATRQRFGVGPKALLAVVLVLGVFTTGWFASRIYVNMKRATHPEESGSQTDKTAVVSKAALSEPQEKPATEPAADIPADSKPARPSIVEVVDAEPEPEPPRQVVVKTSAKPVSPAPVPAPPVSEKPKPKREERPALKINAIAWRNEEPKAIVNMQRVYEGDVIEGATVLAIQRKSIIFEYDGESFEVRF